MKDFILQRPELKVSALAERISWDKGSMNQWLKGNRRIPDEKADRLEMVLEMFGYNPDIKK